MMINNRIAPQLHDTEYRRCLAELDVPAMRRLHFAATGKEVSDSEALATMHYARTQAGSINSRSRAYSHAWLLDHGLPSGLPDPLKPMADRLYPRVVTAVGVAVGTALGKTAENRVIERAICDAIEDMYADGVTDPVLVKPRMIEVYRRTKKNL